MTAPSFSPSLLLAALALLLCFIATAASSPFYGIDPNDPTLVHTSIGDIRGFNDSTYNVRRFLSIPFAQPPIGNLRFRPPVPLTSLPSNPFPATNRTYIACAEVATSGPFRLMGSEDCLTLSITIPAPDPSNPPPVGGWPVLVYIYGGGFTQAYPEDPAAWVAYGGRFIFVSINYRLGVFGFFSLPQLSAELRPISSSGNQGLQDQTLALRFVHDHIADFAGNPGRVTIAGQSAGAQSVCMHLVMPASRGLFSGGIMESHGCDEYGFHLAYAEQNTGGNIVAVSPCKSVASDQVLGCLRNLSTEALWGLVNQLDPKAQIIAYHYFQPVWDGLVIPQPPINLWQTGDFSRVPLLLGTNYWEMIAWLYGDGGGPFEKYNWTWANVTENILWYGNNNSTIVDYYRSHYPDNTTGINTAFIESLSWQRFHCPTRRVALGYAAAGLDVFAYVYDYVQAGDSRAWLGHSGHSAEMNAVYNHTGTLRGEDVRLSAELQNYWLRFIMHGSPSAVDLLIDPTYQSIYNTTLPTWPVFDLESGAAVYIRNEATSPTGRHFSPLTQPFADVCDPYWTPVVSRTPVVLRYTQCLNGECGAGGQCVDNYDNTYQCQCYNGWVPVSNGTNCVFVGSSSGGPTGPTAATGGTGSSGSWTSAVPSSTGTADTGAATCDTWCIVAIAMIVVLSIGFVAALYRLYYSSSRTGPPKPPQEVPAATPRQPRASRQKAKARPAVESVNTSSQYAPVTPVLQANAYEGGLHQLPVLQANPYEGSLAPPPGEHVVDVPPVLGQGGDVYATTAAAGTGVASPARRKKKVKRQIRIDTGDGADEALLPAQPRQIQPSQPTRPVARKPNL